MPDVKCYSIQENESLISHPGGVEEGSQGLCVAKPQVGHSISFRILKGCEISNEKMTTDDLSHPFRMQYLLRMVPGVSQRSTPGYHLLAPPGRRSGT